MRLFNYRKNGLVNFMTADFSMGYNNVEKTVLLGQCSQACRFGIVEISWQALSNLNVYLDHRR